MTASAVTDCSEVSMQNGHLADTTREPRPVRDLSRSASNRVRVLVADGHPLYREAMVRAVRERPELQLVGSAREGREALEAIETTRPDVAVVDRALDGLSGEQVLNAVRRDGTGTRVVLIADEPDPRLVYAAIAQG